MTDDEKKEDLGKSIAREIARIADTAARIKKEMHRAVVGKDDLIETLFVCLLVEGNILIEGYPGVAKTTSAKLFAHTLGCKFNRQQFTADVLPSDVTGSYVFDQKRGEFYVRQGGIFANIVMVDEINRAPPKTQAALLESMEERSVTIEGTTFPLERPFMVIATQSSIVQDGVYQLPVVQVDRFAIKLKIEYPDLNEELEVIALKMGDEDDEVVQVVDTQTVLSMIDATKSVHVDNSILHYIRDIVTGTRNDPRINIPVGPRGSIALARTSRALAAVRGRDYVTPVDVKHMAPLVLNHRFTLSPSSEMENLTNADVIADMLQSTQIEE